jgi:hypothetical protein
MLAQRLYVPTATMIIIRTLARHMATTARNGSSTACSSAPGRGFTDFMDARAFTAEASTVVATMAAAFTEAGASVGMAGITTVFEAEDLNMRASDVEAFVAANFMEEEGFTAAVTDSVAVADSMVEADSTAVVATAAGFMEAVTAGTANLPGIGNSISGTAGGKGCQPFRFFKNVGLGSS